MTMSSISGVMDKKRKGMGKFVNSASYLHAKRVLQREDFRAGGSGEGAWAGR